MNHYFTKSLSELRERTTRTRQDHVYSPLRGLKPERVVEAERAVAERDETILTYLPALREALS